MSYHKSSQRVMVTRSDELWEVVEESYGNSFERLTITLHHPFSPLFPRHLQRREIALVYTDLGALRPLKKGGMGERYRCFSLPLCASVIQGKRPRCRDLQTRKPGTHSDQSLIPPGRWREDGMGMLDVTKNI